MTCESSSVRKAWETNARWWSDRFGEGNDVAPPVERLLDIAPEARVLDIACGNGAFSRRLADLGAQVTAFDFSFPFIECARELSSAHAERIRYHVTDATRESDLLALGTGSFDAAVSNMALMDMSDISVLASCLPKLLKPGGRFVFSIMHPCFNNPDSRLCMEHEDREGKLRITRSVKAVRYLTSYSAQGIGIPGQPVPQTYFHRSLQDLLAPFLAAGFAITGLEETAFRENADARHVLSWDHYPEIPPVLAVRMERGT